MTKRGKVFDNRRRQERHDYSDVPLYWRRGFSNHWHHASLHDVSVTGLGLLTHYACRLKVGQMIELFCKGGENHVRCCVVRTEPWGDDQTLVGGQIYSDDDHHALIRRSPKTAGNRRHPIRQAAFANRVSSYV